MEFQNLNFKTHVLLKLPIAFLLFFLDSLLNPIPNSIHSSYQLRSNPDRNKLVSRAVVWVENFFLPKSISCPGTESQANEDSGEDGHVARGALHQV
jgi:hypothetical protein